MHQTVFDEALTIMGETIEDREFEMENHIINFLTDKVEISHEETMKRLEKNYLKF